MHLLLAAKLEMCVLLALSHGKVNPLPKVLPSFLPCLPPSRHTHLPLHLLYTSRDLGKPGTEKTPLSLGCALTHNVLASSLLSSQSPLHLICPSHHHRLHQHFAHPLMRKLCVCVRARVHARACVCVDNVLNPIVNYDDIGCRKLVNQ